MVKYIVNRLKFLGGLIAIIVLLTSCGNIEKQEESEIEVEMSLSEESSCKTDDDLDLEDLTTDELLDGVMQVLSQKQCGQLNLIYDGMIKFLNKDYYVVSSFDDFEDHILRKESYYIDSQSGQIYRVEENADSLRTELYYVGDLCMQSFSTEASEGTDNLMQIILDFLQMNPSKFQEKYKMDELYEKGILYCNKDAWKYDGSQLDAFQDEYYDIEDITAIRIYKNQPVPVYQDMNIGEQTAQCSSKITISYHTDYAVSIYTIPSDDNISRITEISFIRAELAQGTAPEQLYHNIENDYYEVREHLENETWVLSPDREKAACVSNGALLKHPSQIFVWNGADRPLTVFRRTWQYGIAGWIDNDHLVCYAVDTDTFVLIHLERNEIESIISEKCQYDAYGIEYIIQDDHVVAQCLGEQLCQWEILKRGGEVFVVDTQ